MGTPHHAYNSTLNVNAKQFPLKPGIAYNPKVYLPLALNYRSFFILRESVKKESQENLGQLTPTYEPTLKFHRFGTFTGNFWQKWVKYAIKTVIYKSLGSPDPTHPN